MNKPWQDWTIVWSLPYACCTGNVCYIRNWVYEQSGTRHTGPNQLAPALVSAADYSRLLSLLTLANLPHLWLLVVVCYR